jgi:4-amino-4-deoxy-L-arabinose transferase-like glycosyltransferase
MKRLVNLVSRALDARSTWKIVIAAFLWLAATAWTHPLLLPDEGRYVGVAWSMLDVGQFSVPRLDGLPFFHKPPLFYWITALAMQCFGANEWAARLSSVLSATLMVGLLFWFLKTYVHQRVAIVAALILASQPFLFGAAQYANLDMTVAGMISATVIAGAAAVFRLERGKSYRFVLALAYAAAGFGFLAKGLIGIVLPGGVLFFWLLGRRRFDTMRRLFTWVGIGVFLLVSLPWMLAMQWRYPGFFDYYIVYQHFERFLEQGFNNPHPFWFYIPVLLGLTLPWSLQLWRVFNKTYWSDSTYGAVRGLMLSWLLVVLIFFSLPSSKLVGYILPASAPFAFFLAEPFAARLRGADAAKALNTLTRFLLISIVICLAAVIALIVAPQPNSRALVNTMRADYRPADKIVMLDRYRYDLNFYLRTSKSVFVVSNWDDPELKSQDNWRKELFDAGQFEPDAGGRLLIKPQDLIGKLCADRVITLWLWGDKNSAADYPFLASILPYAVDGKSRVWRIQAGPPLNFCAEMPKSGPE